MNPSQCNEKNDSDAHESSSSDVADKIIIPAKWNLDTIPPELFLLICSFLTPRFVIITLTQVCKKFHEIIQDEITWKTRLTRRWPKKYPLIEVDESFNWKRACIQREEQHLLWSNCDTYMKKYCLSGAHYAAVDVVLLLEEGRLCASGSRDHSLKIWDISMLEDLPQGSDYSGCLKEMKPNAHSGWIWSMAYGSQTLYSGSWDGNIKSWNMEVGCTLVDSVKFSSAVLCLSYYCNLLAAGTYCKEVCLIDPRVKFQSVMTHSNHKKPVLCMVMDEKFIISGSEDETLLVYDKTAGKLHTSLKLNSFPMSLSYGYQQLWIGDRDGLIHVIDTTKGYFFSPKTFHSGHQGKVTGIRHSLGSITTCSMDKTIRILEPCVDPEPIAVLSSSKEIAGISSYENILVSANSDSSVCIWLPNKDLLTEM